MKGQKVRRNYFNSIRSMVMIMLLTTGIICITLIAGGSYMAYRASLLDVIGTNHSDVLSQIGNQVRTFQSNANTVSNLYYNDKNFILYTRNLTARNKRDFYMYMDELTDKYKVSFNQVNLGYEVVYLSVDGTGYSSMDVPEGYDYIDPTIRIWYKDLYNARGNVVEVASFKDKYLGKNYYIAARTVQNIKGEITGYLMILIDEEQIYRTYYDVIAQESNIYVANEKGDIISSDKKNVVGTHYFNMTNLSELFGDRVYAIVQMTKRKALFSKYTDEAYHFTVFEETPLDYVLAPIRTTRNLVVGLTLLVIALGALLAWIFSARITEPIMKLRDYVLQVETGDLDAELNLDSYSEINILSAGIRQMLARIRHLIASEKKKEEQKRKMHYNLLQAQINPHFMYNTLFSIKCVIDMNERQKASNMLSAFIQLLRSTLSNPDSMSTVRQQVEALHQYADLQRFRYGEKFDVVTEYDDAISDYLLPSLLIQPLVENAIIHGVANLDGYGIIAVSARKKQDKIVIEVEDNGAGMPEDTIEEIFSGKRQVDDKRPHIGLKNIDERIKLSFGEEYGLRIESRPGDGTKIIVRLPVISKKTVAERERGEVDETDTCAGNR